MGARGARGADGLVQEILEVDAGTLKPAVFTLDRLFAMASRLSCCACIPDAEL